MAVLASPPPPDDVSIPFWIVQTILIPIAVGIVYAFWYIGTSYIEKRDEQIAELREELKEVRQEVGNGNTEGAAELRRLESKLDSLLEETGV